VILDTTNDIIATHERQEPRVAVIANVIRQLRAAEDEIDGQRFQADRARELKGERRQQAVAAIVADLRRLEGEADAAAERAVDEHAEAERQRVAAANGHMVDPARIAAASSPAELVLLLKDAEVVDADSLRRTWAFCEPRLRAWAQQDMRNNRLPNATSAFAVLTMWGTRVKAATQRTPDRAAVVERASRDRSALRQRVLMVARLSGLDVLVERAARRAAVGELPKGTTTFGKAWDQLDERKRSGR
jgi:hypothetical protein